MTTIGNPHQASARLWLIQVVWIALVCGSPASAADVAGKPATATGPDFHVASSALLTVDATPTEDTLVLHIRRAKDRSALISEEVTVTVEGKSESVTRQADSYEIPIGDLRDGPRPIDIVVGHDGIREILSGRITVPEAGTASSLWREHKQLAWWILNIVIVLIAVIAISRRRS